MRIAFITVGDPRRLTGGYLYHREVFARLRARGVGIDEVVASGADVADQLAAAPALGARIDPLDYDVVVVDALARAVAAPWLDRWRALRPLVAMVHELPGVAGGQGNRQQATGNRPGDVPQPEMPGAADRAPAPPDAAEQAWEAPLLRADRLITVSADGAAILRARGVPAERIVVAPGGFDRLLGGGGGQGGGGARTGASIGDEGTGGQGACDPQRNLPLSPGERSERSPVSASAASGRVPRSASAASGHAPMPCTVLCVAQWIPRKGLVELVRAWGRVARPGWALELVGENDADPAYAALVRTAIAEAPAGSVLVRGALSDDDLRAAYARAAFFALPSRYEGYGIAFAEALAHGLPVVACAVGPVPDLVGPAAGLLVPLAQPAQPMPGSGLDRRRATSDQPDPGQIDESALAAALARLIDDESLRATMATAALARAASLPSWEDTARAFLGAVCFES